MKTFETWNDFAGEQWKSEINVRDFIQSNYTPYEGDGSFLTGPTARTSELWQQLGRLFELERQKGVVDAETSKPQSITTYGPGYIDRDREVIVGLQTDAPLKRGIFPKGGIRMVENSLKSYGYELDPLTREIFTKYRKTHNEGVFSAYNEEILACRHSAIITGLPDAYGRGRIIGDYRRVALYGVDRLIEDKEFQKETTPSVMLADVIRDREELSEQIRALKELKALAGIYGCDISKPASNVKEAIQAVYFAYLAAVKQ